MARVIQLADGFVYGDAIGNHIMAIDRELKRRGIETYIFANIIDSRLKDYGQSVSCYDNSEDDIILYHLSTGTELNRRIAEHKGKKIINYHNITPAKFFENRSIGFSDIVKSAYEDTKYLSDKVDMAIADSEYNAEELRKMGYKCPVFVVPIIINFQDYDKKPNESLMLQLGAESEKKIIYVGRIAPNKNYETIIKDFYYYNKYFNKNSKLYLVGNSAGFEIYMTQLKRYIKRLKLNNIIFTGHVKFDEILAYYNSADLLLCESDHEGFCVPLVEAMYFNVPIIAHNCSAVGETLGNGGIAIREHNPKLTASIINELLNSPETLSKMREEQNKRIAYFKSEAHVDKLIQLLLS